MKNTRYNSQRLYVLVFVAILLCVIPSFGQQVEQISLTLGKAAEYEISGGGIRLHTVNLEQGQVLRIAVREKGINVQLKLFKFPVYNKALKEVDFGSGYDRETLTLLVEETGEYVVAAVSPASSLSGKYELFAEVKTKATPEDTKRAEAEKLLARKPVRDAKDYKAELNEVIKDWKAALNLWNGLGEKYWEGYTNNIIGGALNLSGDRQEALKFYDQALPLARAAGDKSLEASVLRNSGVVYSAMGKKSEAVKNYNLALEIYSTAGDKNGQAGTYNNIGAIYDDTGKRQEALDYYENKALPLFKAAENRRGEATTLNNIGGVYSALGEKPKALDYFEKRALPIFILIKDARGAALTLNNIGGVYSALGEKQKAFDYYENKALPIFIRIGDKQQEATTYNNIGSIYDYLDEKEKALDYYEKKALPLFKEVSDRRGEATTLSNIGGIHDSLGNKDLALDYYEEKALPIFKAIDDKNGEAVTYNNIGGIYASKKDAVKALGYYLNQALPIFKSIGNRQGEATTLSNIGGLYERLGDKRAALDVFQKQVLPMYKASGDLRGEANTLTSIMVVWKSLGNSRLAIFYGKLAVNRLQKLRSVIQNFDYETQKSFLRGVQDTYWYLAELLIKEDQPEAAIQILNFYQDQEEFDFNQNVDISDKQTNYSPRERAAADRYEVASEKLRQIDSQIEGLKNQIEAQPNERESAKLKGQLKASSEDFISILDAIAKEFAEKRSDRDKVSPVEEVKAFKETLVNLNKETAKKTAALYTLIGSDTFYVLLVAPDGRVTPFASPVLFSDFNAKVKEFYNLLQSPAYEPQTTGKQLYDIILKKVEPELKKQNVQTLLWSLNGTLRYIPMAALFDGEKYLVEDYQNAIFTRAESKRMQRGVRKKWTGIGFGVSERQTVKIFDITDSVDALPGVVDEMRKIFKTKNSDASAGVIEGEVILDKDFTTPRLFDALKKAPPIVHIASHFVFNPGSASRSFLVSGDGAISLEEIKLKKDIFTGVELLTLSACRTAAQQPDANGREIDGFAELAQRLGAGAVMATLWSVADVSTPLLMGEFYKIRETDEKTKAEALQQAQINMLKGKLQPVTAEDRRRALERCAVRDAGRDAERFVCDADKLYSHPYFWSPFVLIGNWH